MTTPSERAALLDRQLLTILSECGSYLLPEPMLQAQLNLTINPPVMGVEFSEAIAHLERAEYLLRIRPELGGPVKVKLTDTGRAALAS